MTPILEDKIFISTRPTHETDDLPGILSGEGAIVIEFPLIQIKGTEISESEKKLIADTRQFDWIVFTSPNGVRHFFRQLKNITGSPHIHDSVKLAVIGNKTEQVLLSFGYHASFVNPGSTAEDFVTPFLRHISEEQQKPDILLPLGNLARTVIQDHLNEAAQCTRINIYQTETPESFNKEVMQRIEEDRYDMIIFTSPSGIRSFMHALPDLPKESVRMACIGEITLGEALKNGYKPEVTAAKSSAAGLVESIINYYISKK